LSQNIGPACSAPRMVRLKEMPPGLQGLPVPTLLESYDRFPRLDRFLISSFIVSGE
jgi:hypothetical protein